MYLISKTFHQYSTTEFTQHETTSYDTVMQTFIRTVSFTQNVFGNNTGTDMYKTVELVLVHAYIYTTYHTS